MVALARRLLADPSQKKVFHCWARCVRRLFLCGRDPLTGKDYSHRRRWIVTREEQLAALFAIEIEFRSELSNHLHLILRTRPDVARRWSRLEVARRWLTITRLAKCMTDDCPVPDRQRIKDLVKDKKRIARLRRRLSNISWFMGTLCENIARRANDEDDCSGRFWGSRFGCRVCTDEGAILLCGIYVDLNPIKAGEAKSPETARFTSIYQRLQAKDQRANAKDRADGWLGNLTWDPKHDRGGKANYSSRTGRRASDQGLLSISLENYVKLLKWTLKLLQRGPDQKIPADLEAMLDHMDVNPEGWYRTVDEYEQSFGHAVGSPSSLERMAEEMGANHMKGMTAARLAFK